MSSTKFQGATATQKMHLAIKIASESSIRNAALQTGISRGKIRDAIHTEETKVINPRKVRTAIRLKDSNPLVKELTRKTIQLGVEKASDEIKNKITSLVGVLYSTAEEALVKTRAIVKEAGGKDPVDDWKVAQLRYLVSVWDTAIQDGQLLLGKAPKEGEGGDTYNYTDARQIILARIDSVSASKTKESS